ncbi:MAG TPA: long-chain fatty acid--CoA ligase [Actinomycetota bacterium]|nr:long-chain fatty acid--CoA ligase [Actinomycetota bacterium]
MSEDAVARARQEIEREIQGRTLCDLLADHAAGDGGDAPAMSWKRDGQWRTRSWREHRERVAEAAVGLARLGVGRGDFVAIMATNRPEHVVADQAAVHAGATPSTFYFTLAPEQIRYCAGHCEAKVAVLENRDMLKRWQEIREGLPALRHLVVIEGAEDESGRDGVLTWDQLVAGGREALAADPGAFEELRGKVRPEDAATLLYTSGTTGPPKGVLLTHHNLLFESAALNRLHGLPTGGSSVSYLPLAHIAERVLSIYGPLTLRSHIWFCPDPAQAVEYVREARPTLFFGVPRVWEKVRAGIGAKLAAEENERKRKLAQSAVATALEVVRRRQRGQAVPLGMRIRHAALDRLVLARIRAAIGLDRCTFASSAASPLAVDVAEYFAALGLPLVEVYGMTETTGVATGNPPGRIKIGTVGPAIAGVEVRLADDGEVLVRGPVNTPGYFRQEEATRALIDQDGWLHTGDVGELDADGYLRIVDRKKELIITSAGKNLSPANIEGLLKEHPLVGQALAYGDNRPYVVALIVLDHEMVPAWAARNGVAGIVLGELAAHEKVLQEVRQAVDAANQRLARAEQVKRFEVLPVEWTAESEELTPTLKLRRRIIHAKYAEHIDALYGG